MPNPIRTYRHFRDVPPHLWRWPNFSPAEIACRSTGQLNGKCLPRKRSMGYVVGRTG
jgi:hypothetical protein